MGTRGLGDEGYQASPGPPVTAGGKGVILYVRLLCMMLALLLGAGVWAAGAMPVALAPLWKAGQFSGIEAVEHALLSKTNDERLARELPSLRLCPELEVAARQHSLEMGEKGYFEHESPQAAWHMPWQRSYCAGYWGYQVGENLLEVSLSPDDMNYPETLASKCMTMWMGSPSHCANILEAKWTLTGIGVTRTGNTLYCTQLFAAPAVTLEGATIAEAESDLLRLHIDGTVSTGLVMLWVNGQCLQTIYPRHGEFTTTISYPRNSGSYAIALNARGQDVWTATLDTDRSSKEALQDITILRTNVVNETAVTSVPFAGMRVTGTVLSPAGQPIDILRDGEIIATLTPDAHRRAAFDLLLPHRAKLYTLSFMTDQIPEDLLYIDTSKPLAEAFRYRP